MSLLSRDARARFDPFKYVKKWAKELDLPTGDEGENAGLGSMSIFGFDSESEEILSEDTQTRIQHKAKERRERMEKKADEDKIELQKAKDRLAPAEILLREGKLVESISFCGAILTEEMGKSSPRDGKRTMLLRQCIMQLLLIFCERHPDILRNWSHGNFFHQEYLDKVLRKIRDTDDVKLLKVIRDLAGYTTSCSVYSFPGPWISAQIYEVMLSMYGVQDQETLLALKYLAESYVYDGCDGHFRSVYPWPQREKWIHQHAAQLRKDLGADHPHALKYRYAMARTVLAEGSASEAKDLLREAFDGCVSASPDVHTDCDTFIDGLLEAYCEEYAGKGLTRDGYNGFRIDGAYVDELVQFCLGQEAYEEIDALVQGCAFPQKATNARSRDQAFANWFQFEIKGGCKIQPRLASYKAPRSHMYWEDSRMYFRTWNRVTLTPAYPEDPSPKSPVKIIVTKNSLKAQSCKTYPEKVHTGAQQLDQERDLVEALRKTEIWQLLESKRRTGDWKILLALRSLPGDSMNKDLIVWPAQHEFFVFPEDQWLVVTFDKSRFIRPSRDGEPRSDPDLNHPIPGNVDGEYATQSFDGLKCSSWLKDERAIRSGMEYSISDPGDHCIDITVPYVSYQHFQGSRAYDEGFTYTDYLTLVLAVMTKAEHHLYAVGRKWCATDRVRSIKKRNFPMGTLFHGRAVTTIEDLFWDEMNRREKWDRKFEQRMLDARTGSYFGGDVKMRIAALEKEKQQEDAARVEWDTKNAASL
ncbi:hypothetical protein H2199_003671 [Coniosporium tulheliwenetii]|uniref:Uncharacterized protein n=1 Tax=Coniosporium tulheliwenetii TaxID=3383036 RepID=A0ACC2ZBN4_9PEZI|nr:hypothetical protein H2199_003671 [Cladosporium sp. JES 115]